MHRQVRHHFLVFRFASLLLLLLLGGGLYFGLPYNQVNSGKMKRPIKDDFTFKTVKQAIAL